MVYSESAIEREGNREVGTKKCAREEKSEREKERVVRGKKRTRKRAREPTRVR